MKWWMFEKELEKHAETTKPISTTEKVWVKESRHGMGTACGVVYLQNSDGGDAVKVWDREHENHEEERGEEGI